MLLSVIHAISEDKIYLVLNMQKRRVKKIKNAKVIPNTRLLSLSLVTKSFSEDNILFFF